MPGLIRFYRLMNILSIDVVAGATVSALFFAKIFDVQVRPFGLLALGVTVWGIYTLDHLKDAKKIRHQASTERHRFHQRHFKVLTALLCAAVLIDIVLVFFIKKKVFEWGIVLAIVVGLYLLVQHVLRFLKELFIALLYTCGVLLLSLPLTPLKIGWTQYGTIIQFGLVAWINLIMFSWFDQEHDRQDRQNSFVTILGSETTCIVLYALILLNFILAGIQLYFQGPSGEVGILGFMNLTLLLVFHFRRTLARDDQYRLMGDAVFLFPVFYLV
jgi:hypothetical protein